MAREISLTRGKVAIVDDEDFERVVQFSWHATTPNGLVWYAATGSSRHGTYITLHRYIMGNPDGLDVDHIDGNGLNNRRLNLRVCTHRQNMCNSTMRSNNTSGYKGVVRNFTGVAWRAQIKVEGKVLSKAPFVTPEEAARWYDRMAIIHFGEYAATNFPKEEYLGETDYTGKE